MRKLGMIGGTSWFSTVEYYQGINKGIGDQLGVHVNPNLILYSLDISLMRRGDPDEIRGRYLEIARILENAGAEGIVICANTPHMVYDYVQPKINIPFLHIAQAIGAEASQLGLGKLGLLGTKPTMLKDFIPSKLQADFNIDTIIPQEEEIDTVHHYISKELTQGIFKKETLQYYQEQIANMHERGADGIILGCTELPLLFKGVNSDVPLLNTTDLHIQMAVNWILD